MSAATLTRRRCSRCSTITRTRPVSLVDGTVGEECERCEAKRIMDRLVRERLGDNLDGPRANTLRMVPPRCTTCDLDLVAVLEHVHGAGWVHVATNREKCGGRHGDAVARPRTMAA